MNNYEHAGNFDRLYEEELSLLEAEDFDNNIASIRLLGRDMAKTSEQKTIEFIKNILDDEVNEQSQNNLVIDMMDINSDFDEILNKLNKLNEGINDIT